MEELQQEIQLLNIENLRLRTSELRLAAELKKEREKCRKDMEKPRRIVYDAEIAVRPFETAFAS